MIRKTLLIIICFSCLIMAVGCGNGELAPGDENTISIEVVNNTEDIFIAYAVFFGEDLDEWGTNMLGDLVIEPGNAYTFVLPEGTYDMSLLTYELYVIHNVSIISDDISVEVGGADLVPILIENNSESDISLLYLSTSDKEEWGEDWLGANFHIPAETGRRFFFIEPNEYDLLMISTEGETVLEVRNVEIDSQKLFKIDKILPADE